MTPSRYTGSDDSSGRATGRRRGIARQHRVNGPRAILSRAPRRAPGRDRLDKIADQIQVRVLHVVPVKGPGQALVLARVGRIGLRRKAFHFERLGRKPVGNERRVKPVEGRRAVIDVAQPHPPLGSANTNAAGPQAPAKVQAGVDLVEPQMAHREVIHRQRSVPASADHRGNFGNRRLRQPAQHVQRMQHVHQDSAARPSRIASPAGLKSGCARIVGNAQQIRAQRLNRADRAAVDRGPDRLELGKEQVVVHHRQDAVRGLRRFNHCPGVPRHSRQGLFGQHVLARVQGGQHRILP